MANFHARQPKKVRAFFDDVSCAADVGNGGVKRISAGAARALLNTAGVPDVLDSLLGRYPETAANEIMNAVLDGCQQYRDKNGFEPDPTLIDVAIESAIKTTTPLKDLGIEKARFDSATNSHHDQLSLQPATAVVAILAQMAEAIPFVAYLPAAVDSNEARLAIIRNTANSDFGEYLNGDSLDGIAGGKTYMFSERVCVLSTNGGAGPFGYTVTQKQSFAVGGVAVAGGNVALPVLRGRTCIMVNGILSARDAAGYGSGSNTIAGTATVAGSQYAISGTINTDTGVISVSSSPALPAGTVVEAYVYIDFEKQPGYTPKLGIEAQVYSLYAVPSRALVVNTIDSTTQFQRELALDPVGQALYSLRAQRAQELHYRALFKMKRIAANLTDTWDYDWANQKGQKTRDQIWLNLASVLGGLSQRMANSTIDHGITELYMTGELGAQVSGLPSTIFQSSGISDRPGIFRKGRLFDKYNVWYTPNGLAESGGGTTAEILCIGRGSSVARNPIVAGAAVPETFLPLATGSDLSTQNGFYARDFLEVNPHAASALGSALISVTNIK